MLFSYLSCKYINIITLAVFNKFAEKYADKFDDDFDATGGENKLEFTNIYKEFCKMFEECIEGKIRFLITIVY